MCAHRFNIFTIERAMDTITKRCVVLNHMPQIDAIFSGLPHMSFAIEASVVLQVAVISQFMNFPAVQIVKLSITI